MAGTKTRAQETAPLASPKLPAQDADFACGYAVDVSADDNRSSEQWARSAWDGASAPRRWLGRKRCRQGTRDGGGCGARGKTSCYSCRGPRWRRTEPPTLSSLSSPAATTSMQRLAPPSKPVDATVWPGLRTRRPASWAL